MTISLQNRRRFACICMFYSILILICKLQHWKDCEAYTVSCPHLSDTMVILNLVLLCISEFQGHLSNTLLLVCLECSQWSSLCLGAWGRSWLASSIIMHFHPIDMIWSKYNVVICLERLINIDWYRVKLKLNCVTVVSFLNRLQPIYINLKTSGPMEMWKCLKLYSKLMRSVSFLNFHRVMAIYIYLHQFTSFFLFSLDLTRSNSTDFWPGLTFSAQNPDVLQSRLIAWQTRAMWSALALEPSYSRAEPSFSNTTLRWASHW